MKTYDVLVWETVGGKVEVAAESNDEAIKKAYELLEKEGASAIYETTHREYHVVEILD
jgi:hypothetical protein